MIERFCEALGEAHGIQALQKTVLEFTHWMDFDAFGAFVASDPPETGATRFENIYHMPPGYIDLYASDGHADPVMQHCKNSAAPLVWDQATYGRANKLDHWDAQAQYGMKTGICLTAHLPDGVHISLGITRNKSLAEKEAQRLLAMTQLFFQHLGPQALAVLAPAHAPNAGLSDADQQLIRLLDDGHSLSECASQLGLGEAATLRRVDTLTRKIKAQTLVLQRGAAIPVPLRESFAAVAERLKKKKNKKKTMNVVHR